MEDVELAQVESTRQNIDHMRRLKRTAYGKVFIPSSPRLVHWLTCYQKIFYRVQEFLRRSNIFKVGITALSFLRNLETLHTHIVHCFIPRMSADGFYRNCLVTSCGLLAFGYGHEIAVHWKRHGVVALLEEDGLMFLEIMLRLKSCFLSRKT